ncbi:hypothetical protein HNO88_003967 [Novosphingobium chloroacetimidivorans]|uniref:Uncharacterized protein n=1 Tax=Novosphingobium chloroacetimidivorans TaxID=1428314 RepID=A0A7W7KEB5_9SPHN|nr:hypothetical protein [Novosphingobium chloroacetimidivorans]MBB4860623.1 hypothetical protein [Novosphingobium chloroacetimidivorans]
MATDAHAYPYAFHVALDGNGVNGLEGMAGVCLFRYDPHGNRYAWKIRYFDGIGAGHAVSIDPTGRLGFLGNAGQHLLFYDALTLAEVARQSTLAFECPRSSVQGSTHLVWTGPRQFLTAIGDHFYSCDVNRLDSPERLVPHGAKLPHAMRRTASGRYVVYGSMDQPADRHQGEARHIGIWDLETGEVRMVDLPATCWHIVQHPREDLVYAVSFRAAPQDGHDYHEWGMAWLKEYVFEIDIAHGRVRRHWVAGRDIPAHINSDVVLSDSEVVFCNGGSQTVIGVSLENMASWRIIVDEKPGMAEQLQHPREVAGTVTGALARGNIVTNSRHFVGALKVSRGALLDSIYGCQISADQTLMFTANRGLNRISVYDYPSGDLRLHAPMPELQDYFPWMEPSTDPRLGFHHAALLG